MRQWYIKLSDLVLVVLIRVKTNRTGEFVH